jgi:transposase InsO family protein
MQACVAGNSMPHETSSLSYTQNGSTDDPSNLHALSLIHRVSDTPENGYCESFNSSLRDEPVNGEVFYTLREAQTPIERWRHQYNTLRRTAPCATVLLRPKA